MRSHGRPSAAASAFTLIELLIVIGIIALLIGILLPAATKVRIAAQRTATLNTINRISAACEQYFGDFNSYPGPAADTEVNNSDPATKLTYNISFLNYSGTAPAAAQYITSTENMVLGLLGGLRNTGTLAAPVYVFDLSTVGQGPASLNPTRPGKRQPYLEVQTNELSTHGDNAGLIGASAAPTDSSLPEIMDSFGNPHAILFMRARRGAAGFIYSSGITTEADPQYDIRQLYAYNFPQSANGGYASANPLDTTSGLAAGDAAYFGNRELSRPNLPVVQHKGGYILISAGHDGIYGTADDVRN